MVQTVTGDIGPETLGLVLEHEHVFGDGYDTSLNPQSVRLDHRIARHELEMFKAVGGTTLVDQSGRGGPDREGLRLMSVETGINIVAGTGFYWERGHPEWLRDMTERDIVELLVTDITEGFDGTDIRAGIIGEIGTHHRRISPAEERVFRACAAAQRETRVPIATHALFTRIGLEQARLLADAGADIDKVVIGHCDTAPDLEFHIELLEFGVWIGYDSVGQLDKQFDEERADALMELVGRGWAERILVSSDFWKRDWMHSYGGAGYTHVVENFTGLLRERGADDLLIDTLLRDNPRRLFTFD